MKVRFASILAVLVLVFARAGTASAALHLRGQGTITSPGSIGPGGTGGTGFSCNLIYDDIQDITWLNFTQDNDFWQDQVDWAENLVVNFNGQDLNGWRLPSTNEGVINLSGGGPGYAGDGGTGIYNYSFGYNMDLSSEMARLYYDELGNKGYYALDGTRPQPGWGLADKGPLTALVDSYYWSGTEYSPISFYAWSFGFYVGDQFMNGKDLRFHALAVFPGDVPVPVPAAVWLLGSGLVGLFGLRNKIRGE